MNIRTQSILEAAIKEYIKSGEPISSKELARKYGFGVKDATIRAELNQLTKEGFLEQQHTSGGRVPTDRGYQLFVGNTLSNVMTSRQILKGHYGLLAEDLRKGHLRDFVEGFAEEAKLLGAGHKNMEPQVFKSGLNDLFAKLDLSAKKEFQEIVEDFDMLDKRLHQWGSRVFKMPQVFIGKKSPITKSQNLSVIMDSYNVGGNKFLIAMIGPKRMEYDKNLNLFKLLRKALENSSNS
ncbi:MAG: hypothetical protein Q8P76_00910 [bacterium]|nr:hypothetical protein [bacterium]